jgi:release factor glutamine methyltransferase
LAADRIHFLEADMFRPIEAKSSGIPSGEEAASDSSVHSTQFESAFDLVVSNPPYIPLHDGHALAREVRDHEPAIALYGGEEGYELYAGLVALAAFHLKPGGIFVAELGHDSLPAVQPLLDSPEWTAVGVTNDLAGIPRVIAAERRASQ